MRTFLLAICLATIGGVAHAQDNMMPLKEELLEKPIYLNKNCSKVKIIEWKPSKGFIKVTGANNKTINFIAQICNETLKDFPVFISAKGYSFHQKDFTQTISILPARMDRDGSNFRNLNDVLFRFSDRSKEYDKLGRLYPIWGYFQSSTSHIYLRNDILNDDGTFNLNFKISLRHELFHALSFQYLIYEQHAGSKNKVEEELAEQFSQEVLYDSN